MIYSLIVIIAIVLLVVATYLSYRGEVLSAQERLQALQNQTETANTNGNSNELGINWTEGSQALEQLGDKLGRSGYLTSAARKKVTRLGILAVTVCALIPAVVFGTQVGLGSALVAAFIGCYLGLTTFLYYLRFKVRDYERELLFQTPLFLEAMILLVESGMGILPAIEAVAKTKEETNANNPLTVIFRLVYNLAAHGLPFGQALELVANATDSRLLRHVLLHLDISGNEGGELIPSLRSLSDHAHTEWKLSVEHRVRRLENFVVFPVFASVLGLMLLTASVPIVPLLSLKDSLDNRQQFNQISIDPNPLARTR